MYTDPSGYISNWAEFNTIVNQLWNSAFGGSWSESGGMHFYGSEGEAKHAGFAYKRMFGGGGGSGPGSRSGSSLYVGNMHRMVGFAGRFMQWLGLGEYTPNINNGIVGAFRFIYSSSNLSGMSYGEENGDTQTSWGEPPKINLQSRNAIDDFRKWHHYLKRSNFKKNGHYYHLWDIIDISTKREPNWFQKIYGGMFSTPVVINGVTNFNGSKGYYSVKILDGDFDKFDHYKSNYVDSYSIGDTELQEQLGLYLVYWHTTKGEVCDFVVGKQRFLTAHYSI